MIYSPRDYQKFTTQKIIENKSTGAFLDMGLGKTVATLTAITELYKRKEIKKVLVIAPKKVAESVWPDEIKKWEHTNNLSFSKILGTEKERLAALKTNAQIFLINRENVVWLISTLRVNWDFDMLVIDELSSFKSYKSKRFKALKMVRTKIKKVVGLTGTPAPNGLLDLWSQVFLLDGGKRLGISYTQYRDTYFEPDKRNGHVVFNYKLKKSHALLGLDWYKDEIMDRINDICFSMRSEDYLQLPGIIDNVQMIELPDKAQKKYDEFEKENVLLLAEKEITAVNAAALTNKLLQFANGAVYDEDRNIFIVHDEKLIRLDEIVQSLNEKPVLVFYSFISDKEIMLKYFNFAKELKTSKDIEDWNAGKIKMLITHPASAGHGLNLQYGGENICWFGCPWSLELYQQGVKRIHRNGVASVVTNTRIVVKNTMDEAVLEVLSGKNSLQQATIAAVKARIEKYK